MFRQITDLGGNEWYLIASLWIFLLFFIVVGILLVTMRKEHIEYMEKLPLDGDPEVESDINDLES